MKRASVVTGHLLGAASSGRNNSESRVALITGGTSGIGKSVAEEFSRAGYHLVLCGLEKDGDAITDAVAALGGVTAIFVNADLSRSEGVKLLVDRALGKFRRVDVVVNVAGVQHVAPVENFPESKWDLVMAVNVKAAFLICQAVWPSMKARRWGRLIHVSSVHGLRASSFKCAYVASKHALLGLSKVLSLEGAPLGITSNVICPGYVKTPLVDKQIAQQALAHNISKEQVVSQVMLAKHAVKQFVDPQSIADMCLFFCSPASGSVTGSEITLDGGWTAQ